MVLAPALLLALDRISVFKDSPIGYTIWFAIISIIIDVMLKQKLKTWCYCFNLNGISRFGSGQLNLFSDLRFLLV